MSNDIFLVHCPYDDCQNMLALPATAEESDVIVCRTNQDDLSGCNRNTEVKGLTKDAEGKLIGAELSTLEIDEDWGE